MMNDLEAATRSNLVLLLSGFAHEEGGGPAVDRLWPVKQKGPTATVERSCVTGAGLFPHGNSAALS